MLLQLEHLERRYNGKGGVGDVSLHVPTGAVYALCGSNGSGKTTTLSVLSGLLFARKGSLAIDGQSVPLDREARRVGMGIVPDIPLLDENLTGWQWASFVVGIKQVQWPKEALETASLMHLDHKSLDQPIRTLSFGNRRKLALWIEMMTTSSVLLLDEPLTGLDPEAIEGFHEAARLFASSGRAIIMSTHLLREAEALATHVGIIAEGETRLEGTLGEVRAGGSLHEAFLRSTATL